MLDKINKKKNVNVLLSVQKCDFIATNNLQLVTRKGTKIGNDNPQIRKTKKKYDYPNLIIQKQLYNDASDIFQELASEEIINDNQQNMVQEIIDLMHKDNSIAQFIDLLYNIKNKSGADKKLRAFAV